MIEKARGAGLLVIALDTDARETVRTCEYTRPQTTRFGDAPIPLPMYRGDYTLTFENTQSVSRGHISAFEPPTVLEYHWYEGETIESVVRPCGATRTSLVSSSPRTMWLDTVQMVSAFLPARAAVI